MLHFEVKNLGPIAEGAVDLKPLTVFIGPNSSGKSYMATLIYAAMVSFRKTMPSLYLSARVLGGSFAASFMGKFLENKAVKSAWEKWLIEFARQGKDLEIPLGKLTKEIKDFMNEALATFIKEGSAASISSELRRCYGANIFDIVTRRKTMEQLAISIKRRKPRLEINFSSALSRTDPLSPFRLLTLRTEELKAGEPQFELPDETIKVRALGFQMKLRRAFERVSTGEMGELSDRLMAQTAREVFRIVFQDLLDDTYYLPAARSGILQGHKGLAGYTIKRAPLIGLEEPLDIPKFTGVIADFLYTVLNIERREESMLSEFAQLLEREVTGGRILMEAEKHLYPEIFYYAEGVGKLALHRVSSGISELAPMILFLKYVVEPGDLLVIEEPEAHLHPAAQRKLAKVLVRLIRARTKVLITTHSDFLLQQLSNFVAMSKVSEAARIDKDYGAEDYLNAEDVGAYLFRFDEAKNGTVVEKLKVDSEEGIRGEEFGNVAEELYEESVNLQQKVLSKE